jgi:hypothetical protein
MYEFDLMHPYYDWIPSPKNTTLGNSSYTLPPQYTEPLSE